MQKTTLKINRSGFMMFFTLHETASEHPLSKDDRNGKQIRYDRNNSGIKETLVNIKNVAFLFTALFAWSNAQAADFRLTSQAVKPGSKLSQEQVYKGFGCEGKNLSPDLKWTAGPKGTKSYAVTVYDPDAPTGSGWWHWLVYNLPADVTALKAGSGEVGGKRLPTGAVHGRTDFGTYGFGGACPPEGDKPHRYIFTVFALKTAEIKLPKDASAALIGYMLNANRLAKASFTANYYR
jgi:Raf kinase inhibitor-like YbhB/YbcL family protein